MNAPQSAPVSNILFLCTGNSARSILGEVLVNSLEVCAGRMRGFSAGSFPKGQVNPYAVKFLQSQGLPMTGLRSKSWDEFNLADAPKMDFIITVCDQAAGEQCPLWPGQPMTLHWGMPDPAAVEGTDEQILEAFRETYSVLKSRIERLCDLPLETLSRADVRIQAQKIGSQ